MNETELREFERELRSRIRGDVLFDEGTRGIYSTDASIYQRMPVAVVLPRDEADVQAAVQVAAQHKVSLLCRGAGTSLSGQCVNAALIIDFSKYMNRILELDIEHRRVRVQPGIVLDELNAALSRHGLLFAPDPATSSRATIGGMIGNNSSGTKSIIYGLTKDHVLGLKILLADGTMLDLKELSPEDYEQRCRNGSTDHAQEAQIYREFRKIIDANREEITRRYPTLMRRVQGYNLDAFISTDRWNLAKLIVGSEGTLALTLEATLNLEPLPKHKSLCVLHYHDLLDSIRSVAPILAHHPSAVEILDKQVLSMARRNLTTAPLCGFMQGEPAAVLIVEFFGDTRDEASQKAAGLARDMESRQLGYARPVLTEPAEQANVWAVRKHGLGLMLGMKGERKPIPFIEDACIPIEVLPEYIDKILCFCRERGVPVTMYAHASVGTIHVRPVLNLKVQNDIELMKAIAEFSFSLVQQYGGSVSSEHGDGRVRSPFLERFYGPQIYQALRTVKQLFDPASIMNPKIIIDPDPMDTHLRYGAAYEAPPLPTTYHFREDGGFTQAVEMCTGVGHCRQNLSGTMCPSYRATRDEEHSTRGRANALRLAMAGRLDADGLSSRRLFEVLDLCLSCKACKSECPSNVDMARLKSEFLQQYHDARGTTWRERMIAGSPAMAALCAGWKAPVINWVMQSRLFRKLLETMAGIDARRSMPPYARIPFTRWFSGHAKPKTAPSGKVVLFEDTYLQYHETEIGISAVALLESCGYDVLLSGAGCCQRPRISHGFLREAKEVGEKTLRKLDAWIQQGLTVVVCEPSCYSALTDDLPDLIEDEALGSRIKAHVVMIDEFLYREYKAGRLMCEFTAVAPNILVHGHCHQKSLYGTVAMKHMLSLAPGVAVKEVDSGCCGMAGSFGFEQEHYQLSQQIGEGRLFPAVRQTGDETTVIACGFSCRHQILDATGKQAKHWVEVMRGKLRNMTG